MDWKLSWVASLADDHLVKKFSLFRKILQNLILGHPNKILTLLNFELVGCNHLGLEEESLTKGKVKKPGVKIKIDELQA